MRRFIHYWFSIVILSYTSEVVKAQSSTVRPYQFGFTIDQQQHRYEKRGKYLNVFVQCRHRQLRKDILSNIIV
ncbi:hypothetical protein GQX74_003508 [Glossina fuscipes]|nr:hypothetical protein GQX74_003508 [Glossina fuscipes]